MSYPQRNDANVPTNDGVKRNPSKFLRNVLLVGAGIAVLVAMAGWLYFLGWLGWHFITWI